MTAELALDDARTAEGLKPSGAGAVMASRAGAADAPASAQGLDFFPTPPWAARAGGELIKAVDPNARTCWEPACGAGHMAHGLRDYFDQVLCSDIADHRGGRPDGPAEPFARMDFLAVRGLHQVRGFNTGGGSDPPDWIVSNPPFKLGEAFIRQGWKLAGRGVAMLLRLQFIETIERHALFTRDCRLSVLAPFPERVPMVAGRWDPEASSATAYAWFIFDKAVTLREPVVRWVPPGTKARLTRPGDRARFGMAEAVSGVLDL